MDKEEIIDQINQACSPELMSKQEALDFIGDIVDDLQMQMEALETEIENEEV